MQVHIILASPHVHCNYPIFIELLRSTTSVKQATRDYCGMYAFNKWLEHRICSWSMDADTRRLLLDNEAPFKQEIYFHSFHFTSFVAFQTTISCFFYWAFSWNTSVSKELHDCSNLDDLQWTRSMRPIRPDVADVASLQQLKGNRLRLASLEVN